MGIWSFANFVNKLWLNPQLRDSSAGAAAIRQSERDTIDRKMMERCIALSRQAGSEGELPFAAIICRGDEILAEVTNQACRHRDATQHAEMIAVSEAQRVLGHKRLTGCTLYSNVEPCAMCAWPIRETGVSRVVFSIKSPHMGGLSKWNVLGDLGITNIMRGYFRKPPEIVTGLLLREAEKVWRDFSPLIWSRVVGETPAYASPSAAAVFGRTSGSRVPSIARAAHPAPVRAARTRKVRPRIATLAGQVA